MTRPRRVGAAPLSAVFLATVVSGTLLGCGPSTNKLGAKTPPAVVERAAPPEFARVEPHSGEQVPAPPGLLALGEELERAKRELGKLGELAPYFIAYSVTDYDNVDIEAQDGALLGSTDGHIRVLDTELRVGSYELDSTHPVHGFFDEGWRSMAMLPLDSDEPKVLRELAWLETDNAYREASERFLQVKADAKVRVGIEDQSGDFTREQPIVHYAPPAELALDRKLWQTRARELSARFLSKPGILESSLSVSGRAVTRWLMNTEGTRMQTSEAGYRIELGAKMRADDGMLLERGETFDAASEKGLPSVAELEATIDQVVADLAALKAAPPAEPFLGPAILAGRAAGVFFHEIFGHRMEGERQKLEQEGQTFAKKIGQKIIPEFISVYDDPSLSRFESADLNGFYRFDDQGVPAQRASLVEAGVLKGFLMSRVPVRGVKQSNGHGRRAFGSSAMARQANLVVEPSRAVPMAELRKRLLEEARKQNKEYGLLFADIAGGFTQTARASTQGFKVLPVMVYRVFVDGRPDELIRGVDVIGTPLTSLTTLLAASDDYALFNGMCGAESGWVPVSAISPSLLVRRIEVALRDKESEKPPILPPPTEAGR